MAIAAPELPHPLPVHPHSQHSHPHRPPSRDREHERDVHGLRLALGSILSPKRYSPSSRASSGSASPCPAHFGPGLVHPYHHPSHLHTPVEDPVHDGGSVTHDSSAAITPPAGKPVERPEMSRTHSDASHESTSDYSDSDGAGVPVPAILTTSNVHALSSVQTKKVARDVRKKDAHAKGAAQAGAGKENDVGSTTPGTMGGYIATLQSTRAWDALVHGNMS